MQAPTNAWSPFVYQPSISPREDAMTVLPIDRRLRFPAAVAQPGGRLGST